MHGSSRIGPLAPPLSSGPASPSPGARAPSGDVARRFEALLNGSPAPTQGPVASPLRGPGSGTAVAASLPVAARLPVSFAPQAIGSALAAMDVSLAGWAPRAPGLEARMLASASPDPARNICPSPGGRRV
jgi:hypothetical protein